jgi:hypothetical protein
MLWITVPVGMSRRDSAFPGLMSALGPLITVSPTRSRSGARM